MDSQHALNAKTGKWGDASPVKEIIAQISGLVKTLDYSSLTMYALYAPIQATYKESQSLKGLAKMKYDKEHKDSLSKYPELKERMQSLLQNGEKITPKQWKAEIQSLQSEYDSIGKEQTKTATELAYAEVISYNKKNLERELQNESRQQNRQQVKIKRREEEI